MGHNILTKNCCEICVQNAKEDQPKSSKCAKQMHEEEDVTRAFAFEGVNCFLKEGTKLSLTTDWTCDNIRIE
jgi:hypothetical protein